MRIRPYRTQDFVDIVRINDESFIGEECPPESTLREMISISDVLVADATPEGFGVIGFIIIRPEETQTYLWSIAVDKKFRTRGVASNLLIRGLFGYKPPVRLHCKTDNPARRLYEGHGFVEVGREAGYYMTEPTEAVVYERRSDAR